MSDYTQLQIIVIVLNKTDPTDDSITIVRNIAIDEDVEKREVKKAIDRAINQIEDEF